MPSFVSEIVGCALSVTAAPPVFPGNYNLSRSMQALVWQASTAAALAETPHSGSTGLLHSRQAGRAGAS